MSDEPKIATVPVDEIQAVFDEIGKLLHDRGIVNAVVLVQEPKHVEPEQEEHRMFFRGNFYEAARLVASASRTVRQKMNEDLRGL
jgi:hypothetical protein